MAGCGHLNQESENRKTATKRCWKHQIEAVFNTTRAADALRLALEPLR